nr:hypothetical protein [Tanacetum cinerariifolium]
MLLHILTEFCTCIVDRIMPPKMMKRKVVKKMVKKRIAEAIEEYENTRVNPCNVSGSGVTNAGGSVSVQGCTHNTFMNGKPHLFNETEGVVGLRRWIEKVEQVFEICKCAEEDKVMFAASTFEGRALTWWNGNEHTIGLDGGRTLDLDFEGDDIEAYNNRSNELALMCPDLVPNEKKKIKRYMKGFPKRIKGNITSSRPTILHDAINLARELVEQAVQAPVEGKVYARTLPKCNRCNLHHNGQCPLKCRRTPQTHVSKGKEPVERGSSCESLCGGRKPTAESECGHEFTPFINISPIKLNTSYEVELADGKTVSTNIVLRGWTLALFSHMFKIDLLPTRLGSFDVIIGMDWLSYHRAIIVYYEKIVCIPLSNGEILEIHGERPEKDSKSLSCIKADEKRLNDIRTVRDFPEVFPD